MGYYTNFYLNADMPAEKFKETIRSFEDTYLTEFDFFEPEDNDITGWLYAKWYEFEEDMIKLSTRIPNTLFTLKGFGEEKEDMWVLYAKNGKIHREMAEIVFPDFDESMVS